METWDYSVGELMQMPFPYQSYQCDSCGWEVGHQLQYCWYCPGKLYRKNITVLQRLVIGKHSERKNDYEYALNASIRYYRDVFCTVDGNKKETARLQKECDNRSDQIAALINKFVEKS